MKRKTLEKVPVGKFEISSGKVVVSDPCYDRGTWCAGELENILNGTWYAFLTRSNEGVWGVRCAEIEVVHKSMVYPDRKQTIRDHTEFEMGFRAQRAAERGETLSEFMKEIWKKDLGPDWVNTDIDVGVDSGQAGIFDASKYVGRVEDDGKDWGAEFENSWYGVCCDVTLNFPGAGVLEGGVVSSSGYGDGCYDCFTQTREDGKVVGVKIVFIPDEWEEEEENESE